MGFVLPSISPVSRDKPVRSALPLLKNSPCRHVIVSLALLAWLALTVSAGCAAAFRVSPLAMPACPEKPAPHKAPIPTPHCSLKACLASPLAPGLAFAAPATDPSHFVVFLVALVSGRRLPVRRLGVPALRGPPPGCPGPLFYRFCILLN